MRYLQLRGGKCAQKRNHHGTADQPKVPSFFKLTHFLFQCHDADYDEATKTRPGLTVDDNDDDGRTTVELHPFSQVDLSVIF